jgi:hypothetical protein
MGSTCFSTFEMVRTKAIQEMKKELMVGNVSILLDSVRSPIDSLDFEAVQVKERS